MSGRGVDFLKNWIDGNVTEADKYGSHDRAKELVVKCVGEAKAGGLTLADMELEPGDLETMIMRRYITALTAGIGFSSLLI